MYQSIYIYIFIYIFSLVMCIIYAIYVMHINECHAYKWFIPAFLHYFSPFLPHTQRLPCLTSLNLYGCNHITSASLCAISKRLGHQITSLIISHIPNFTSQDILDFLDKCPQLEFLDFHGSKIELTDEFCVKLAQICETRKVKIVYRWFLSILSFFF